MEVSISSVPAATHLPVSVTSYYIDSNVTRVGELRRERKWALIFFSFLLSRDGRKASNYKLKKDVYEACSVAAEYKQLFLSDLCICSLRLFRKGRFQFTSFKNTSTLTSHFS